jgi:Predicted membrane protein
MKGSDPDSPTSAPHSPDSRRCDVAVATAWGAAEATFFFLVPDVWLTRLALKDRASSLLLPFAGALAGALAGGALLHLLAGSGSAAGLLRAMDFVPAIDATLIQRAGNDLQHSGWPALFRGALTGTPYKLYAVHAGAGAMSLFSFLAVSVVARGARFALTLALTLGVKHLFLRRTSLRTALTLHAVVWSIFYLCYFAAFRG